jgi:hypothetical protein
LKSFRLYIREPVVSPPRLSADLSPEERERLKESFRPIAERHRRSRRIAGYLVAGGIALLLLGYVLPTARFGSTWGLVGFLICLVTAFSVTLLTPALTCPACANELRAGLDQFCPECGVRGLAPASWFRVPHCSACGRDLGRRKTHRYEIRACTHCGLWLDDEGL